MIGWLSGTVRSIVSDTIILDVGGVGYEVIVSGHVFGGSSTEPSSPLAIGSPLELVVYTDVRENALILYGFARQIEKEVFLLLKKVKGVGSKVALAVVSWLEPEGLLAAIAQSELKILQSVPGVGKKLAERMVVELREHVAELVREPQVPLSKRIEIRREAQKGGVLSTGFQDDVLLALEKLGFPSERAQEVVSRVLAENEKLAATRDTEELLRLALVNLS